MNGPQYILAIVGIQQNNCVIKHEQGAGVKLGHPNFSIGFKWKGGAVRLQCRTTDCRTFEVV